MVWDRIWGGIKGAAQGLIGGGGQPGAENPGGFDWSQLGSLVKDYGHVPGAVFGAYQGQKDRGRDREDRDMYRGWEREDRARGHASEDRALQDWQSRAPLRQQFISGVQNIPNLERPDLTWNDPSNRHAQGRPRPAMPQSAFAQRGAMPR